MNNLLAAALDAWDAGLSVIPVRNDGTKRPTQAWKQYQVTRADRDTIADWFTNTNLGLGVICGAVSGDLEMLELEGRFVAEIGTASFKEAADTAGLAHLLKRLINGFMVYSPSDGRHFYYRVDGGEAVGNRKLAARYATTDELAANPDDRIKVLIETRGEGGFVVAPPSSGSVHQTGRAWSTRAGTFAAIPTITVDERDAFFALCATYDTIDRTTSTPVDPVPPSQRAPLQRSTSHVGSSWYDAVIDHLTHTTPIVGLLEHYGWTPMYLDGHGRQLLTRPGKDNGVSGSVNTNGRLCVFTTSTPFDAGGHPPTTYDVLDVIAAYEHHGNRNDAARSIAERTGILEAWKVAQAPPARPPANVNPDTGEIAASSSHLDAAFWNARPYLAHIHQAARSRIVAPAAVLGAVLARVAAFTPPSTRIPPIIGTSAPLSSYFALMAASGGGKSASTGCASELIPNLPPGCVGPLPLGSGEGLVDAYFEMADDVDGNGKKTRVKRQTRRGALFVLDEGQALSEMTDRKGATIMPNLRSAWSGGDVGQANASIETRRILSAGSYATGLVSLWQYKAAARLMADEDGGTPQRFVFIDTVDATITDDIPEWPGSLPWEPPAAVVLGGFHQAHHLELHDDIRTEVVRARIDHVRGTVATPPLDAHRRLVKLKIAGLFAVLDNRHHIDLEDWALAERLMSHSDDVRSWILAEAARVRSEVDQNAARRQATVAVAVEETVEKRALIAACKAVTRAANRVAPTTLSRRQANHAVASRHRQLIGIDDVLAECERLQWLARDGDDGWRIGTAKPI